MLIFPLQLQSLVQQRLYGSQSLKYLPSGPSWKKFANPCSEVYSIHGNVFLNLFGVNSSGVKSKSKQHRGNKMVSVPYHISGPTYVSSFGMENWLSKPHSVTVLEKKKKKLYNYRLNSPILQVRKPRLKKLWHSVWANQVAGKKSTCQCRRCRSTPGSGWSLGEGNGKPTPVFLPGKFHGQTSLVGYNAWHRKESDGTEQKHTQAWVRPLAPAMWAG